MGLYCDAFLGGAGGVIRMCKRSADEFFYDDLLLTDSLRLVKVEPVLTTIFLEKGDSFLQSPALGDTTLATAVDVRKKSASHISIVVFLRRCSSTHSSLCCCGCSVSKVTSCYLQQSVVVCSCFLSTILILSLWLGG